MAKINLIHADAAQVQCAADIVLADPPFDMPAARLSEIINNVDCEHLVLITTMRQLIGFMRIDRSWELSFDFVLDAVVPKKSRSIRQPNYTHATGAYLTKNGAKSLFNRKLRQRSDTFENNGYWPTVLRAPRERMADHGMAKNEAAITDIIGSFNVKHVYDPFAGSGTTGFAALSLGIDATLCELDGLFFSELRKNFNFFNQA